MWNHDIWGEFSSLKSPFLTFHQIIFLIICLLTQNTYTHTLILIVWPWSKSTVPTDKIYKQPSKGLWLKSHFGVRVHAAVRVCMCVWDREAGGRGRSQEWPCVFDRSVFCGWFPPPAPPSVVWSASHRRQLPLTNTQQERCLPLGGWVRMCVCMGGSAGQNRDVLLKLLASAVQNPKRINLLCVCIYAGDI